MRTSSPRAGVVLAAAAAAAVNERAICKNAFGYNNVIYRYCVRIYALRTHIYNIVSVSHARLGKRVHVVCMTRYDIRKFGREYNIDRRTTAAAGPGGACIIICHAGTTLGNFTCHARALYRVERAGNPYGSMRV